MSSSNHDLRQPLQSISLLNAALLRLVDDEGARRMLLLQSESIAHMRELLNSVLAKSTDLPPSAHDDNGDGTEDRAAKGAANHPRSD